MSTAADLFELAVRYHRSGDLPNAERLYRQILAGDAHSVVCVNLGALLLATGNWSEARGLLQKAVTLQPALADAHFYLGSGLLFHGEIASGMDSLRRALTLNPDHADAHNNLGRALAGQGRLEEAAECFRQAVRINPQREDALANLGNALREWGSASEAVECFQRLSRLNPKNADAHYYLGNALKDQNLLAEAAGAYREAVRLNPKHVDALNNLGIALYEQRQHDDAAECFRQALRQNPNFADAQTNLGTVLFAQKKYADAAECFRQALRSNPRDVAAHTNLGTTLRERGLLDEAIFSFQQALQLNPKSAEGHNNLGNALRDQGRLDEALASYQNACLCEPAKAAWRSNRIFTQLYHPRYDSRSILEEHHHWERAYAVAALPRQAVNPSPGRRLRIGYVSPDFRDHVVGQNVWPLLSNHDHAQFEITLYANPPSTDARTLQFQACADRYRTIAGLTDRQAVDLIQQDSIDILVDLALHTCDNRLLIFAHKPAPLQVTFAGYPGTTGLSAIDYRLTDPYLDPPGQHDDNYAEASYRLPHSFWCYDPRSEEPLVSPLPALSKGQLTFGCLNNFCKVNDAVLSLWAEVLGAVPGSQMLLLSKAGSHRRRTLEFMSSRGVHAERIIFASPKPRPEYLALYHHVDIGLDTFPYNGHTTSLDSYWMGVPVVTLVGQTVVGRAGLSQLSNLGLENLAASTPADFVKLAVGLAGDLAHLDNLRNGLRHRMRVSPLMDALGFARAIENAYREMWQKVAGTTRSEG